MKPITQQPVKVDNKEGLLLDAVKKANAAYSYQRENMSNAEYSLSFIFGEQYTAEELKDKDEMNRLSMTFNKLPQFINKVTGAQRAAVHTINVTPATSGGAVEEEKLKLPGGEEISVSDAISDMVREIEYSSNAKAWYKMAFKHALEGGFGYLRVLTEYQKDSFDLGIKIKGIRDRWSVLIDPKATEPDLSDMNYCFISESITKREFEKRNPGKSYDAIPGAERGLVTSYWETEEMVTVTEYFRREPYKKTLALGSNGQTYVWDDIEDKLTEMAAQGIEIIKTRSQMDYRVIWCKITQGDILEKDIIFPTDTIPIVPVLGRQFDFREKSLTRGLVDDAIDAQIAQNKMKSSALERIDSSPINPFVATDKAIEGYEDQWAEANSVKYSTLTYRKGEERPSREMGAAMPVAELETARVLDEDMKASIGIFNSSLGQKSNEVSGKAIEARKTEADIGTFEFIDNYNNAIKRVGLLVVQLIPKVYDTNRTITLRDSAGDTKNVELNKQDVDLNTGVAKIINNIKDINRSVEISVGQSYESKQQENASQILELMNISPKVAEVGSDLLVRNLDFAESDVLAERLEKTIPPQFLSKERREELSQDKTPPEPTPEEKIQQMEMQMKEAETKAKETEGQIKIQIEQLKLEQAKVALETKEAEAKISMQREGQKNADQHQKRQNDMSTAIIDQMKAADQNKKETQPK